MSVTQTITLHGGPRHGQIVALEGAGHSLIIEGISHRPNPDIEEIMVPKRGTYTRVRGSSDFEWIGWQTP